MKICFNCKKTKSIKNFHKDKYKIDKLCSWCRECRSEKSKKYYSNNKNKIMKLIGCNIEQLKQHLQNQFKLGMSWDNHGKWHIDHIRPCASFDLSKPEEQRKCFHYTNLQPLWAEENISKKDKVKD
jgi:hypothetical protein